MAFNVYHNPSNVAIDATPITGVQSITLSAAFAEITAAGDDDEHVSIARYATRSTRGRIAFLDPIAAEAAAGQCGTLSFRIRNVQGSGHKLVTIVNASIGGYDATIARDRASACELPFIAETAPAISDAS